MNDIYVWYIKLCLLFIFFELFSLNGKITLAKPNVPINGHYCTSKWPWPLIGLQCGH